MIKILALVCVFGATALLAVLISAQKKHVLKAAVKWILGLMVLIAVVLFAQSVIFEWLEWNGTDKNDWFFMLWWAVVLGWYVSGLRKLFVGRL